LKETKSIDATALQNEAKKSEHRESYMLLERKRNYRAGVGAEIAPSGQPTFFFEILVNLCSDFSMVDLSLLERSLVFLKDLKARGYSMSCQDDNFVSCQKAVTSENLAGEYKTIRSMTKRIFQK